MLQVLKIVLFLFLLPFGIAAQVPTSGLIGAWTFSGNANDISPSANHGTVNGASLTADRCGNANSAYSFNGSSSYIIMASAGPTGTLSRSISFWAKSTYTSTSPIVSFDYGFPNGSGGNYQIVHNYNCVSVGLDVSNQAILHGNNCLYNNAWHHIVAVYDATVSTQIGGVSYYIDGVYTPNLACFVSGTTALINTVNTLPINIGRGITGVRYFSGQLDDFYFYNRAITPAEVMQLYTVLSCTNVITGPSTVCVGYQGTTTYSVNLMTGASSYSWTLPGGWTGTSTTNVISVSNGTASGIINVMGISSGTCGNVGAVSLSVTPIYGNTATLTTSSPAICSGVSSTIGATGALNYTWQPGTITTSSFVVTPTATTVYTLTAIDANGCVNVSNITQTVNALPSLSISASSSIVCPALPATLTASGASTYTWQPGNFVGAQFVVTPTVATIYAVTGTDANGCSDFSTFVENVYTAPVYSISTTSSSICVGKSATVSIAGGATYTWLPMNVTGSQVIISPTTTTNYTVKATSVNGCTNNAFYSQLVNINPTINISPTSLTICPNTSTVLSGGGASTYTWLPGGVSGNTVSVSPLSVTVYTAIGTSVPGCTALATRTVYLKATPNLSFTTFSITCGSLGSATVSASGATGPYSYSWSPTTQTGNVATGLFPGIYTLTVLDNGTGCYKTSTTNFLPLVPLTGTVSNTFSFNCNADNTGTASIALSGGSGSQTYTWTSSLGAQTTPTASALAAGVNTVKVVDGLTYCSLTKTFTILQPSAVVINIAASNPSVCMGSSIQFTATSSGGTPPYTYTWVAGPIASTHSVNEITSGNYTYSVSSTDNNNCTLTKTIAVTFVPNPTLTVADVFICPLESATLQANGASTYTWNTNVIGPTLVASPSVSTQYSITGTALSCTATTTGSIVLKPLPLISFTSNAPVCVGDSLKLNGVAAMQSYSWTGPSFFTSTLQNPFITSATLPNTGIYILKVMAPNSCTNVITHTLFVNPLPFVSVSGSTVCEGSNLMLYSTTTASSNLIWSAPGFTSAAQNPTLSNATLGMNGTYSLQAITPSGCINSATTTASVVPKPVIVIVANATLCAGATLSLQASGGGTYNWLGPAGFYSFQQSTSISTIGTNYSGMYTLTVVNGPCTIKDSVKVLVNALPSITLTNNSPICELKPLSIIASGGSSYQWNSPTGNSISQATVLIASGTFTDAGVYTVTVTSLAGCVTTSSTNIQVLSNPIPTVQGATVCLGETAIISVKGGTAYAWTGPAAFTSSTSVVVIVNVSASTSGTYNVVCTGSNGCSTNTTALLQGNPFPLPVPVIGVPKKICIATVLTFTGSGGVTYNWTGPSSFTSNLQNPQLPINSTLVEGIYTLSVKDASNCSGSSTVNIKVLPKPIGTLLSSANNLCLPFYSDFRIKPSSAKGKAPIIYSSFQVENKNILDSVATFFFNKAGIYTVSATFIDTNTCANSATFAIKGNPKPTADFSFSPERPVAGNDEVHFLNSSYGEGTNYYYWLLKPQFNDTVKTKNPVYTYGDPGIYPIVLLVKNNWNCVDTMMKYVIVEEEFTLYVPDAFTPNGDGINDVFQPKGMGLNSYTLSIYDRWGEKVFKSTTSSEGWDGKYRSHDCEDNTYVWKIEITDQRGRVKNYTGKLSLLR